MQNCAFFGCLKEWIFWELQTRHLQTQMMFSFWANARGQFRISWQAVVEISSCVTAHMQFKCRAIEHGTCTFVGSQRFETCCPVQMKPQLNPVAQSVETRREGGEREHNASDHHGNGSIQKLPLKRVTRDACSLIFLWGWWGWKCFQINDERLWEEGSSPRREGTGRERNVKKLERTKQEENRVNRTTNPWKNITYAKFLRE